MDFNQPSSSFLITTFIGSNIVSLGSGTPYIYSYYAPQLLARCNIPIKHSSNIALSLNIGSSLLGMLAGVIVDINPRLASLVGSICTFSAYSTLYLCYENAISSSLLISMALVLVGFGSVCGFYAGMKVCTANFPNHRGIAAACPVSLYGLSGVLFSTICRTLFGDNILAVFLFLLISCSSMSLIGVFTLEIFDYKPIKEWEGERSSDALAPAVDIESNYNSYDNDQPDSHNDDHRQFKTGLHSRGESLSRLSPRLTRNSGEIQGSPKLSSEFFTSDSLGNRTPLMTQSETMDNIDQTIENEDINFDSKPNESKTLDDYTVWECVKSFKFILFFIIIAILQGIGQTYIYSVGFIVQAQVNSKTESSELIDTSTIQATQVAIVSVSSFFGRISSGLFSDYLVKRFNSQRIWTIFAGALLMIIGAVNITAVNHSDMNSNSLNNIYQSSIIFGYAFGAVFGTFPSIMADSFGTKNFSKLWGMCTTGCMFTIKFFTSILAANLSKYTEEGDSTCKSGVKCYGHTFSVIEMCAFLDCLLILFIIGSTYKKDKSS